MELLSERQSRTFEDIKRKKRFGIKLTDWENKFLNDTGLMTLLESTGPSGAISPMGGPKVPPLENSPGTSGNKTPIYDCGVCDNNYGILFKKIKGLNANAHYTFRCPACLGQGKLSEEFQLVTEQLMESEYWQMIEASDNQKYRLGRFLFGFDDFEYPMIKKGPVSNERMKEIFAEVMADAKVPKPEVEISFMKDGEKYTFPNKEFYRKREEAWQDRYRKRLSELT